MICFNKNFYKKEYIKISECKRLLYCLNHEKKSPEGILNHVKTIIPIYNNEYGIEEPAIWIVQHPITVNGDENLSQILELKSTIEILFFLF